MKFLMLFLCVTSTALLTAQSNFEQGMHNGIERINVAATAEDMTNLSYYFERVGTVEPGEWLPFYYAAYTSILAGWMDAGSDKDKVSVRSTAMLDQAETLSPNNSEIYCLRNMIANQQMVVDPMSRWQTYGVEAASALEKAKQLDPTNPRPYFLQAQGLFHTPVEYGGGKAVAKPLYEKSVALYKTFKPASELHPSWGREMAEADLAKCSE